MRIASPSPFLVEIASPAAVEAGSLADRAREAAGTARFLRSIYVPEDDRWFLLYEGSSAAEVAASVDRASLDVISIAVARPLPPGEK